MRRLFVTFLTCCCICSIFSLSSLVLASSSACSSWISLSFTTNLQVTCARHQSEAPLVEGTAKYVHMRYLLSLDFLQLGTRTGQLFWRLLLSQLLHFCLQGSQLLLQSLRDRNQSLRLGQYKTNGTRSSIRNVFISTEKPTPQPSSLWLSSSLVLPVDSAPLILALLPSLESCKEQPNKGSLLNFKKQPFCFHI